MFFLHLQCGSLFLKRHLLVSSNDNDNDFIMNQSKIFHTENSVVDIILFLGTTGLKKEVYPYMKSTFSASKYHLTKATIVDKCYFLPLSSSTVLLLASEFSKHFQ